MRPLRPPSGSVWVPGPLLLLPAFVGRVSCLPHEKSRGVVSASSSLI